MKKNDIKDLKIALSFYESIPSADNNVEEEIKAYHDYYRIFCKLGLLELTPYDNRELARTIQKYIDNTEMDLTDLDCFCEEISNADNYDKISQTGLATNMLEIIIRRMEVNEDNYQRLLRVINCFDIMTPYQVLFAKFQSFMDNDSAQKYKTKAKGIFDADVLDFLD